MQMLKRLQLNYLDKLLACFIAGVFIGFILEQVIKGLA
jgi:hypothetical protein